VNRNRSIVSSSERDGNVTIKGAGPSSDGKLLTFWSVDRANLRQSGLYMIRPDGAQTRSSSRWQLLYDAGLFPPRRIQSNHQNRLL